MPVPEFELIRPTWLQTFDNLGQSACRRGSVEVFYPPAGSAAPAANSRDGLSQGRAESGGGPPVIPCCVESRVGQQVDTC